MTNESTWTGIKHHLKTQLDPDEFATWFAPLEVKSAHRRRLVVSAPDEQFVHTIEQSYRPAIDRAVESLARTDPLEVLFTAGDRTTRPAKTLEALPVSSRFGPRYRFANFVVGSSNQFAHAAAQAVADSPSASYNPLFIYGGVGLGKTHLMQAIGGRIHRRNPHFRVMYLPAEQFVNELINSIRFDRMQAFRDRYRTIDVLLIDDIQFIANKERTQEEFFHTFNTLYTSQKQIILSSDSSPRNIPTLEERLRSRFEWGLITDIQPPDLETKIAILRRKAESDGVDIPDDVALFIAQQVRSNIRELEGLINRVVAFGSLTGNPITLQLAKETLRDVLPPEGARVSAPEIIKAIARHYGMKVSQIKSKSNQRPIVFPRQVAMYLCKVLTNLSYPDIGRHFNGKHHSTVMHSVKLIEKRCREDPDLERLLQGFTDHFA